MQYFQHEVLVNISRKFLEGYFSWLALYNSFPNLSKCVLIKGTLMKDSFLEFFFIKNKILLYPSKTKLSLPCYGISIYV